MERFNEATSKIQNIINRNFEDDDLSGAIKEIHGYTSNGEHLNKVMEGLSGGNRGIKKHVKALREMIEGGHVKGEALESANEVLAK